MVGLRERGSNGRLFQAEGPTIDKALYAVCMAEGARLRHTCLTQKEERIKAATPQHACCGAYRRARS